MKQIIDAVDEVCPWSKQLRNLKKGLPKELSAILNSALQLPEPGKFFLHSMRTGWERRGLLKVSLRRLPIRCYFSWRR